MSAVSITFDTEWAHADCLEDVLGLLDEFDVAATLFSTHDDGVSTDVHERALHPNFLTDESDSAVLGSLAGQFPGATGLRSHGMYVYTNLRDHYPDHGIEYESNYLMYRLDGITPFWMPDGTVQVPVYWMDDQWLSARDGGRADVDELLDGPGLKVFDFHPQHVAFNTPSTAYYEEHKEAYYDAETDVDVLRSDEYGVRDVFRRVLERIEAAGIETRTVDEIQRTYRTGNPFDEGR